MSPHNSPPMAQRPVVILAKQSPALEAIAREVLSGAAAASNTSPPPILVAHSDGALVSIGEAPLVFLGWRSDSEESRREARRALAAVAQQTSGGRYIAKFEASLSGATSAAHPEESSADAARLTPLGPVEPFHIISAETASPHELERARRWGAEIVSQWRSAQRRPPSEKASSETTSHAPHALTWCGAME
jgi:hypothetical protein